MESLLEERQFEQLSYQDDANAAIKTAREAGLSSGLINMATGLGKTYIAARDARDYLVKNPDGRVLYLCHQNSILEQAHETFAEVLGDDVNHGYVFGGEQDDQKQVVYASFQAMNTSFADGKLYEAFDPNEFDYIIDDESHHAAASTYRRVIDYFEPDFLLGLSATPDRRDGQEISDIFEVELYSKTLEEALGEGHLTPIHYKTYSDHLRMHGSSALSSSVKSVAELNRKLFVPRRDEEVAEILFDELAEIEDPHAMIFCQSIQHAERIAELLPDAKAIHSKQSGKEQRAIKKQFKRGELPVVTVVDKFNEGVDLPHINVVGFLRSTSSQRIWLQQLGRGLRREKGKDSVKVVDLAADIDRIEMVMNLQKKTKAIRDKTEAQDVVEYDAPLDFAFTQETMNVIELIKTVRERIARQRDSTVELDPIEHATVELRKNFLPLDEAILKSIDRGRYTSPTFRTSRYNWQLRMDAFIGKGGVWQAENPELQNVHAVIELVDQAKGESGQWREVQPTYYGYYTNGEKKRFTLPANGSREYKPYLDKSSHRYDVLDSRLQVAPISAAEHRRLEALINLGLPGGADITSTNLDIVRCQDDNARLFQRLSQRALKEFTAKGYPEQYDHGYDTRELELDELVRLRVTVKNKPAADFPAASLTDQYLAAIKVLAYNGAEEHWKQLARLPELLLFGDGSIRVIDIDEPDTADSDEFPSPSIADYTFLPNPWSNASANHATDAQIETLLHTFEDVVGPEIDWEHVTLPSALRAAKHVLRASDEDLETGSRTNRKSGKAIKKRRLVCAYLADLGIGNRQGLSDFLGLSYGVVNNDIKAVRDQMYESKHVKSEFSNVFAQITRAMPRKVDDPTAAQQP